MDRRAQPEAERNGERDNASELQALAQHQQHAAGKHDREKSRQDADQHHDRRPEGESNECGHKDDLDRESSAQLVDHECAVAGRYD